MEINRRNVGWCKKKILTKIIELKKSESDSESESVNKNSNKQYEPATKIIIKAYF